MAQSRCVQVRMPQKTYERLVNLAETAGFVGPTGRPVVSQAVFRMIRLFLDAESDQEWEKLREVSGGDTFAMVDSAVREHITKRRRRNF